MLKVRDHFRIIIFAGLLALTASAALSCKAEKTIPKEPDWPVDVPLYPKGKLDEQQINGGQYKRVYVIDMSPDPIVSFYREKCQEHGWKEITAYHSDSEGWLLMFEKGERKFQVIIEPSGEFNQKTTLFVLK